MLLANCKLSNRVLTVFLPLPVSQPIHLELLKMPDQSPAEKKKKIKNVFSRLDAGSPAKLELKTLIIIINGALITESLSVYGCLHALETGH